MTPARRGAARHFHETKPETKRETMSKTMKALVLREHGDLDQLSVVPDYPRPEVKPGHVVIRVGASSFNYHDVFTVKGMPGIKVPMPVIIGLDMAGEIVEIGDGVEGWSTGDRVLVNPTLPRGRPDGRDAGWRHGRILRRLRRSAHPHAVGRELRRRGLAAGGLRHRAPDAGDPQDHQEGRQGAGPRCLGRRRYGLRHARQGEWAARSSPAPAARTSSTA